MDPWVLTQRDAEHPEPVLGCDARAFRHPCIVRSGATHRSDTPDRWIEHEPAALLRHDVACRGEQAQSSDLGVRLHREMLDRQIARDVEDITRMFLDELRNVIASPVGTALAEKPPQRIRHLAPLEVFESQVGEEDRLRLLIRLFLVWQQPERSERLGRDIPRYPAGPRSPDTVRWPADKTLEAFEHARRGGRLTTHAGILAHDRRAGPTNSPGRDGSKHRGSCGPP